MLFIDANSNVDKRALQGFVLGELKELKKAAEAVMVGNNKVNWKKIRDVMVSVETGNDKKKVIGVLDAVRTETHMSLMEKEE